MPIFTTLQRLTALAFCLLFTACTADSNLPITPIPTQTSTPDAHQTVRVEVPVTVEVTRVYTQPIIIEATPSPPRACAQHRYQATGEITVGSLLPLSGSGAYTSGFAMQAALNLAIEQLDRKAETAQTENGAPEISWRLITYDTAGRAERAAEFAHRLITLDCAAVIIGGFHSPVAYATAAQTEEYQIPYIVLHAAADDLTTQYKTVFRIAPTFSMYAQMPVSLVESLSQTHTERADDSPITIDEALFIVNPGTISGALTESIVARMQAEGIETEILAVDLPAQDFSSTVARILSRPTLPDILFIFINSDAALTLHAQLLKAGVGPERGVTIVTSQSASNDELYWQEVPNGTDALMTHFGPWPGDISPLGQEFVADYSQYAEHWPPAFVFAAFDSVLLFADAVARTDSLHGPSLVRALAQSDITLAAGHYRFAHIEPDSPTDDSPPTPARSVLQIHDPHQWLQVPMYYLRYTQPDQAFPAMYVEWSAHQDQPFRYQPLE